MQVSNIIIASLLLSSASAFAGDTIVDEKFHLGEAAHQNHCYKCHTDKIYTREDSFVKSIDALSKQVVRCKDSSNIPWFDEDTETVIHFMNKKFYNF